MIRPVRVSSVLFVIGSAAGVRTVDRIAYPALHFGDVCFLRANTGRLAVRDFTSLFFLVKIVFNLVVDGRVKIVYPDAGSYANTAGFDDPCLWSPPLVAFLAIFRPGRRTALCSSRVLAPVLAKQRQF